MATTGAPDTSSLTRPNGTGRRIGIVAARWHSDIVETLLQGALHELAACGVADGDVIVEHCPGSYEIPVVVAALARRTDVDAVIGLGVVIRGETAHFDYVAGPVAYSLQTVAIETETPCLFGVLTTENLEQALDRAGGRHGNKGAEAALAALETIATLDRIRSAP